ncbi:nuclear fragile X mental retardation-interacting protein 1-domain-containing protein [Cytidiella melzeri]|nr:nuclear fragile X mental retardation-interacting protein 1-domain-containing protein [Cytidiella melzeri]
MQPWHGAPAHPSLPIAPHLRQQTSHGVYQAQYPPRYSQQAAQPQLPYGVSPHYAQAYMQYSGVSQNMPTYEPQASTSHLRLPVPSASSRWYQPGSVWCRKQGCSFTGSQKTVETHMMDRHLIYPPGWESRKRKDDWDADPSLKGKPIPIQGTTVRLDTAEDIEKWIAERKKRFPTAARVEEKRQKMAEAVARGQLAFPEQRFPNKKRRLDSDSQYPTRGRGQMRGSHRGRGRGGMHNRRNTAQNSPATFASGSNLTVVARSTNTAKYPVAVDVNASTEVIDSSASESESDSPPDVASSKEPVQLQESGEQQEEDGMDVDADDTPSGNNYSALKAIRKPQLRRPRRPPQNPFALRPALLRNLLLPEIRMTVSNLSQAIRFLVDNDFLENVELKPGQAEHKMIQVIDSSDVDLAQPVAGTTE